MFSLERTPRLELQGTFQLSFPEVPAVRWTEADKDSASHRWVHLSLHSWAVSETCVWLMKGKVSTCSKCAPYYLEVCLLENPREYGYIIYMYVIYNENYSYLSSHPLASQKPILTWVVRRNLFCWVVVWLCSKSGPQIIFWWRKNQAFWGFDESWDMICYEFGFSSMWVPPPFISWEPHMVVNSPEVRLINGQGPLWWLIS